MVLLFCGVEVAVAIVVSYAWFTLRHKHKDYLSPHTREVTFASAVSSRKKIRCAGEWDEPRSQNGHEVEILFLPWDVFNQPLETPMTIEKCTTSFVFGHQYDGDDVTSNPHIAAYVLEDDGDKRENEITGRRPVG